jgi:hypothetical protein
VLLKLGISVLLSLQEFIQISLHKRHLSAQGFGTRKVMMKALLQLSKSFRSWGIVVFRSSLGIAASIM